ncbi:MAG: ATP-binding cassette domain-containing protein [Pseudomonadota bacterium]
MLERTPALDKTPNSQPTARVSNQPAHTAGELRVQGLNFEAGGRQIISDLSFELDGGGLSVIMGPNGAGKSVLIRLLHGLLKASSGSIHWGGVPVDEVPSHSQALVFQRPVLLRRSVAANIDFVLKLQGPLDREQRHALLELGGLTGLADQPARALSGGEQQRLALVRALALQPAVLFLDEPSASLDPGSVQRIETIILNAKQSGTKIILVTHDVGQARRLADDITFMHRGCVTEQQRADRFFAEPVSQEARGYLSGQLVI